MVLMNDKALANDLHNKDRMAGVVGEDAGRSAKCGRNGSAS